MSELKVRNQIKCINSDYYIFRLQRSRDDEPVVDFNDRKTTNLLSNYNTNNQLMPHNLVRYNNQGEATGINLRAIAYCSLKTTPTHMDLEQYRLVHSRARTKYLEELAKQATLWQLTLWASEITKALQYLEKTIDTILEADETTYACNKSNHTPGGTCPNRRNIRFPRPEEAQEKSSSGTNQLNGNSHNH